MADTCRRGGQAPRPLRARSCFFFLVAMMYSGFAVSAAEAVAQASSITEIRTQKEKEGSAVPLEIQMEQAIMRVFQVTGADDIDVTVLSRCLDKHQFNTWVNFLHLESCTPVKHYLLGGHFSLSAVEDIMDVNFLADFFSSPEKVRAVCANSSSVVPHILPCVNDLTPSIVSILHDDENCQPLAELIPSSFNHKAVHSLVYNLQFLICAERPDGGGSIVSFDEDGSSPVEASKNGTEDPEFIFDSSDAEQAPCGHVVVAPLLKKYLADDYVGLIAQLQCLPAATTFRCCGAALFPIVDSLLGLEQLLKEVLPASMAAMLPAALKLVQTALRVCPFNRDQCMELPAAFPFPSVKSEKDLVQYPPYKVPELAETGPYEPQQVHLALGGKAEQQEEEASGSKSATFLRSMAVTWVTRAYDASITSGVVWGTSEDDLTQAAEELSVEIYNEIGSEPAQLGGERTVVNPKNNMTVRIAPAYSHKAVMDGLQPGTVYYYQVVHDLRGRGGPWETSKGAGSRTRSPIFSFKTEEKDQESFTVAVFGDMGLYNSEETMKSLESLASNNDVDFFYHIGDISYADNDFVFNLVEHRYDLIMDYYMQWAQTVAASKAYMTCVGNHEAENHSPLFGISIPEIGEAYGNYSAFNSRFRMPAEESGGVQNMWFSFDYGDAHFISISTETDYAGDPDNAFAGGEEGGFGDQLKWLEEDLKRVVGGQDPAAKERQQRRRNRKRRRLQVAAQQPNEDDESYVPWIIVFGHRPMYSIEDSTSTVGGEPINQALKIQQAFEELFLKYGVDIFFSGHQHHYERHHPICGFGQVEKEFSEGGDSVNIEELRDVSCPIHIVHGAAGNSEFLTPFDERSYQRPWAAKLDNEHFSVGKLEVVSSTVLRWSLMDAANPDKIIDQFTLQREERQTQEFAEEEEEEKLDDEDEKSNNSAAGMLDISGMSLHLFISLSLAWAFTFLHSL